MKERGGGNCQSDQRRVGRAPPLTLRIFASGSCPRRSLSRASSSAPPAPRPALRPPGAPPA
eukprot:1057034-Pyramimonas_sp.AAC.1